MRIDRGTRIEQTVYLKATMGSGKTATRTIMVSIPLKSGGANFWVYENCKDINVTIPSNTSYPIMYTPGAKYQQMKYYYEYFTTEVGTTTVKDNFYILRPNMLSDRCGQVIYSNKIFNTDMVDVTAQYEDVLKFTSPIATDPA